MPWKPGESGNPAGRRAGTRVRLTKEIIQQIVDDWVEHGPQVLEEARTKHLPAYLALVGRVIPNNVELSVTDARRSITEYSASELVELLEHEPREIAAPCAVEVEST